MKWPSILLVVIIIIGSGLTGCTSTDSGRILPDVPDISIDANSLAPFSGVLVPRPRYDYLLRCEGYVLREGRMP